MVVMMKVMVVVIMVMIMVIYNDSDDGDNACDSGENDDDDGAGETFKEYTLICSTMYLYTEWKTMLGFGFLLGRRSR